MNCDIFCEVNQYPYLQVESAESGIDALTVPDTAPEMKVMANVGSLAWFRSQSQLLPIS